MISPISPGDTIWILRTINSTHSISMGGLPALLHEAMTMKRGNQPDLHPRLFQNLPELVILDIARMREDDNLTEKAHGE